MNWTGGRLSRGQGNKKGSRGLTARQKEHYAKVRASTQNAPHKWSIFNNLRGNIESKVPKDLSPDWQHARQSSHRSSYEPRVSHQPSRNQELLKIKRERQSPEDDYYDATPPPRKIRHNEAKVSPIFNSDPASRNVGVDARRKLLLKGDWAGVTLQKPMSMKFAPQQRDDRIGRRRRVVDGHRARYGSRQFHITSPYASRRGQSPREFVNGGFRKGLTQEDVRISIGGKEVKPSTTSISVSETQHSSESSHLFNPPQYASSDLMPLENDRKQRKETPSSTTKRTDAERWFSRTSTSASKDYESYHGWHASSDEDLSEGGGPNNLLRSDDSEEPGGGMLTRPLRDCNDWEILPESGTQRLDQGTLEDHETHSNSADSDMLRIVANPAILLQRARAGLPLLIPLSPTDAQNAHVSSHSPANIRPKSKSPIFSSSNHLKPFHPKPKRFNVRRFLSRELQSESSPTPESTAAQVGKEKPAVPSSQLGDNAIWETWMFPSDEDGHTEDGYFDQREQAASISPGVSVFQQQKTNAYSGCRNSRRGRVDYTQLSRTSKEAEPSISIVPVDPNNSAPVQAHFGPQEKHGTHFTRQNVSPEFRVPQKAKHDRNIVQSAITAPYRQKDNDRAALRNHRTYGNDPLKDLQENKTPDMNMEDAWDRFLRSSSSVEIESSQHSPSVQQTDTQRAGPSPKSAAQSVQLFTRSLKQNSRQHFLDSSLAAQLSGSSDKQSSTGRWNGTVAVTRASSSPVHASDGLATDLGALSSAHLASPSTANHQSSLYSGEGSSYSLDPYKNPEKNIVFTRPRPFVGRNANFEAAVEQPLHFGHGIVVNEWRLPEGGKEKRYIDSIVDADAKELIEDD